MDKITISKQELHKVLVKELGENVGALLAAIETRAKQTQPQTIQRGDVFEYGELGRVEFERVDTSWGEKKATAQLRSLETHCVKFVPLSELKHAGFTFIN